METFSTKPCKLDWNYETIAQHLAFSDEATFCTSGKANHHNLHVCVRGTKNHMT
jgi:hypothetical protein